MNWRWKTIGLLILVVLALPVGSAQATAPHGERRVFTARLTGAAPVPPVKTKLHGYARLVIQPQPVQIRYEVTLREANGVERIELRLAERGATGPVVAALTVRGKTGQAKQMRVSGVIRVEELQGPFQGLPSLDPVLAALDAGQLYLTVSTRAQPHGAARGQFRAR